MQKKTKILHITPHLGGGVGKVILDYLIMEKNNKDFAHQIACLDYCNENALKISRKNKIKLCEKMSKKKKSLLELIDMSDIIIIHWWNNPLLFDFLVRTELPPCRAAIWSHISGLYSPHVFTKKILNYPDIFVFTTPISFQTKEVKEMPLRTKKKLKIIWSAGNMDELTELKTKRHRNFNIGYVGTVDYAKIHQDFMQICKKIKIPNVKFIICGGPSHQKIRKEAKKLGIADKFIFTGKIKNVKDYLSVFDIFCYPLSPRHFGTCDQALAEGMSAGVAPVVFDNPMERSMVKNGRTGIIAKNVNSFVDAIHRLYHNEKLRVKLSKNARKYAQNNFSIKKMSEGWKLIFKDLMLTTKNVKKWELKNKKDISVKDVFIEALGDYGKIFLDYNNAKTNIAKARAKKKILALNQSIIWRSETRGTVHHYKFFFPKDRAISAWSKLMKNKING